MNRYFLDLFSGIGGFALGAHWAGLRFDAHYFSEVDPYAISVYRKRFPDAIPLGDIKGIRGADLPRGEWIIAGGFPCQDISVAGKGAGLAGARSGLWYEYARLIGELRPRFAIMENVGALAFRGLDSVLGSLAALGYDAEWQDIRASDVGAPHRRERLWIVAYPKSSTARAGYDVCWRESDSRKSGSDVPDPRDDRLGLSFQPISEQRGNESTNPRSDGAVQPLADSQGERCGEARQLRHDEPAERASRSGEMLADAEELGRGQERQGRLDSGGARQAEPALLDADSQRREELAHGQPGWPWDANSEHSRGRGNQWATEPDVGRVAHGIPARVDRLKCLGNSIVPEIAELIFMQPAFDEWRVA